MEFKRCSLFLFVSCVLLIAAPAMAQGRGYVPSSQPAQVVDFLGQGATIKGQGTSYALPKLSAPPSIKPQEPKPVESTMFADFKKEYQGGTQEANGYNFWVGNINHVATEYQGGVSIVNAKGERFQYSPGEGLVLVEEAPRLTSGYFAPGGSPPNRNTLIMGGSVVRKPSSGHR